MDDLKKIEIEMKEIEVFKRAFATPICPPHAAICMGLATRTYDWTALTIIQKIAFRCAKCNFVWYDNGEVLKK